MEWRQTCREARGKYFKNPYKEGEVKEYKQNEYEKDNDKIKLFAYFYNKRLYFSNLTLMLIYFFSDTIYKISTISTKYKLK